MLSAGELIEDVNIYELRNGEMESADKIKTREIVFKTNRRPLRSSMIEKGLAQRRYGYGDYLLARVHAFRSLGIDIGEYRLLSRSESGGGRRMKYFLRQRCPGEPLNVIKPDVVGIRSRGIRIKGVDREFVLAIASLLGNSAAQNLAMKKYIPVLRSCRFGVGKEIFEIGYDVQTGRELPVKGMSCSSRGALGWNNTAMT